MDLCQNTTTTATATSGILLNLFEGRKVQQRPHPQLRRVPDIVDRPCKTAHRNLQAAGNGSQRERELQMQLMRYYSVISGLWYSHETSFLENLTTISQQGFCRRSFLPPLLLS